VAPRDAVARIRASVACLGPLSPGLGRARLALPGGDRIGARSIDLHLRGLEAMGAETAVLDGEVEVRAAGCTVREITLDFPSVGATENLVMAACSLTDAPASTTRPVSPRSRTCAGCWSPWARGSTGSARPR
jgi:UDP-N-acetylglucosamine 1-carboxyvinyltransferase